jgi:hypothetical protein
VSIIIFDPIKLSSEYLCFMEFVREMKWDIFTDVFKTLKHMWG